MALGVVLATILAVAYTRSRADVAYRPYASRGSPLKEETKEKEPSPPKTRPGGRPGIEHELSGAALHVLDAGREPRVAFERTRVFRAPRGAGT